MYYDFPDTSEPVQLEAETGDDSNVVVDWLKHNAEPLADATLAAAELLGGATLTAGAMSAGLTCAAGGVAFSWTGVAAVAGGACVAGASVVAVGGLAIGADGADRFHDSIAKMEKPPSSSGSGASSSGGRQTNVTRQDSKIWQKTQQWRGQTRTNGLPGRRREYYEWDYTHNDIEVYDRRGRHLGSKDPSTGEMYKPAVEGRTIDVG